MRAPVLATLIVASCASCAQVAEEPTGAAFEAGSDVADVALETGPPRDRSWAEVIRDDRGLRLLIEVYREPLAECAPPLDVDPNDLVLIGIRAWDGSAGTFPIGVATPHGTAQFAVGTDGASGTVTIEPFAGRPRVVTYETDRASGAIDVSRCGNFDAL